MFYIYNALAAWAQLEHFPFEKNEQKSEVESVVAPAAAAATNSFCRSLNFRQKADEAYPEPQAGHAPTLVATIRSDELH